MEKPKPSVFRIIQSDFLALVGVVLPVITLVMYIAVAYFGFFPSLRGRDAIEGTESAPAVLNTFITCAVIGIPLLLWRIRMIFKVFENGDLARGQVDSISFFRDRGNVSYIYEYQNKRYASSSAIMKTARTQALSPGMEIILIVDRDNPKRALIRDLYV